MDFGSAIFGSKPVVPTLPQLNLGQEQLSAIANNAGVLSSAESFASSANQFNLAHVQAMLNSVIPGYNGMVAANSKNIASQLSGTVPKDVAAQLQTSDAARALAGGYGGSGAMTALEQRDLGLTSLDLTNQGLAGAESWINLNSQLYGPGEVTPQSMFVSPDQQASFDSNQEQLQFQRQWMQNQINAMPDPVTQGLWNISMQGVDEFMGALGGNKGSGGAGGSGGMGGMDIMKMFGGGGGGGFGGGGGGGSFGPM